VILAAAAAAALAAPSREALIERWLRANHSHSAIQLRSRSAPLPAAPDLHRLAQRELSIPGRYQIAESNAAIATEPWWMKAWDWIAERWQKFWNAIFARVHVGRQTAASFGDFLLVAVGLLLIFVAVRLSINLRFTRSRAGALVEPLTDPPSSRALYRQACDAASRGDYGAAALVLFAATIALLDRRGAVNLSQSATVGDLRRDLRASHRGMLAPFDAVAAPFVQRAYAERAIDESEWEHARSAFVNLSTSTPLSTGSAEG
jgi:hypothetical protein